MGNIEAKPFKLQGIISTWKYNSGEIESYKFEKQNKITINNNEYIPLYSYLDNRRKELPSLRLYKSGKVKSIILEKSKELDTKYGKYQVEKVTFYENGNIKRIFHLDGKISGYWSEDDEYSLAKEYYFSFLFGEFNVKTISIYFYKSGEIKSLTLWPKELIKIKVGNKIINVRSGVSIFENGRLSSCEPVFPTKINTNIGLIEAFDKNALGICGDKNSLEFFQDGRVKSLITSTDIIDVYEGNKLINTHSPKEQILYSGGNEMELTTINIEFNKENIIIDNKFIYDISKYKFCIRKFNKNNFILAGDLLKY